MSASWLGWCLEEVGCDGDAGTGGGSIRKRGIAAPGGTGVSVSEFDVCWLDEGKKMNFRKKARFRQSHKISAKPILKRLLAFRKLVRPDDVSVYYSGTGADLTVRVLPADEEDSSPMVLIEGDRKSFLFLVDLLIAQTADTLDCGFQINLPGSRLLSSRSECGLYVHSLPCANEPAAVSTE